MRKEKILQPVFLLLFLIIGRAFVLLLIEPVDYSIYFNRILKDRAAENGNHINMVFAGASRTLRTFDPDIFEEEIGLARVFNAASGLQPIEASYYMLKEVISRYHLEYAVLGVSWDGLLRGNNTLAKLIVLDRLSFKNRLDFIRNGFRQREYPDAISLCWRFRNNFTAEKIRENILEKITLEKNGYSERLSMPDLYEDNGFIYSYLAGDIPNYGDIAYEPEKIDPKKEQILENIVQLCEENHVRLFLVSAPTTVMSLYRTADYQKAVDYYAEFAAAHGLDYVNLNYLRGREEWLGDHLMFDFNHVNGEGAELVSRKYAEYLNALIHDQEPPDMFYADLADFQSEVHRIIAIRGDISITDLKAKVRIISRQTDGITPLFRISISPDDETYTPLTDWTEKTDFEFDVSAYKDTVHFLIEAISPTGEPGCTIKYHMPV